MVFAMAFESDVAENHHFVVAPNFLECALQIVTRIFKVAGKPFFIGATTRAGVPRSPSLAGSSPAHLIKVLTASSAIARDGRPGLLFEGLFKRRSTFIMTCLDHMNGYREYTEPCVRCGLEQKVPSTPVQR